MRGFGVEERGSGDGGPQPSHDGHAQGDGQHVAERRRKLGADEPGRAVGDALLAVGALAFADDRCEVRGRHGRLLGRQYEAEVLHDEKAQRVVEAVQQPFGQRRQVPAVNDRLVQGGEHGQHPASGRGRPDAPVLAAVLGDVVFALVRGAIDDLAAEEVEVPEDQVPCATVAGGEMHEPDQELLDGQGPQGAVRLHHDLGHQGRPGQAALDDLQGKNDIDAHPGRIEMRENGPRLHAAGARDVLEFLQGLRHVLPRDPQPDQPLARLLQPVIRRPHDRPGRDACAQPRRQALGAHARDKEPEPVSEGLADPVPCAVRRRGQEELHKAVRQLNGGIAQEVDLLLGAVDLAEQLGQVALVARRGQYSGEKALRKFGEEASRAGDAGAADHVRGVGFRQKLSEGQAEARTQVFVAFDHVEKVGRRVSAAGTRPARCGHDARQGLQSSHGIRRGNEVFDCFPHFPE
ncbi:hypothetical protein DSECCO2_593020 [anaerobic digester metagenome]